MPLSAKLLGTGNPYPNLARRGPAVLIEGAEERFLVDTGEGVLGQLLAAEVEPASVENVLITHFHSDHTTGLPGFAFGSWTLGRQALRLIGPIGVSKMWELYAEMFEFDIEYRVGLGWPREAMTPSIHEVQDGWQDNFGDVRINSQSVAHVGPHCFGYRFSDASSSIVVSGDTAYCPEIVALATEADVLINNCSISKPMRGTPTGSWSGLASQLRDHVCTPQDAGRIAAEANVDTLVLTHMQPGTEASYVEKATRESGFEGAIVVGEDLMTIRP